MKKHTFRSAAAAVATCAAIMALAATPAQAEVDALGFELDGNIITNANPPPPYDWSSLFNVSGGVATPKTTGLPSGFLTPSFVRDFIAGKTSDSTTFATGSKDTLNISPGWQCKSANNVTDKGDIANAYAVAQILPAGFHDPDGVDRGGHLIIYFAMEVASNEGTKDVGFWFLKDGTVACPEGNGTRSFTGTHQDGDLLIVSEYTNGGGVATIKAYRWNGDGATGSLSSSANATGADCDAANVGHICATVNRNQVLFAGSGVPWLTQVKTSNPSVPNLTTGDLDLGMFFEGGIDLTATGLVACFNRFLADTRSAATTTATLYDFAVGNFNVCGMTASKSCGATSVDPNDFTSYISTFTATIHNDSPIAVSNVTLADDFSSAATGETCRITAISGTGVNDPASTPISLTSGTAVQIAGSLDGGATLTAAISCDGGSNSFVNSVTFTSNGGLGGGLTKTASSGTPSEACKAAPAGSVDIIKDCKGVQLVSGAGGGPLTLKINVLATVTNPSNGAEAITDIVVHDNVGSLHNVGTFTPVNCTTPLNANGTLNTVTPPTILKPGDPAICYWGSYTPTAPDGTPGGPFAASFSDTARVDATGVLSNSSLFDTDDATCQLCDADSDGRPDYSDPFPQDPNQ